MCLDDSNEFSNLPAAADRTGVHPHAPTSTVGNAAAGKPDDYDYSVTRLTLSLFMWLFVLLAAEAAVVDIADFILPGATR